MTREYCTEHGYQDFFDGAIPDEPGSEAIFCPLCWPDHDDNPNQEQHAVTDDIKCYRLRVFGADDYLIRSVARFASYDLLRLAALKEQVERLAAETPDFEGLSLWNTFQVIWLEELDTDDGTDDTSSEDEVARVSAETYDPNSDRVVRTEYDLVLLDKQGVTFRADMKHTDLTMSTATIEWAELLGVTEAAPAVGAVELIAQTINETGYHETFEADAALAAIDAVRKNLDLMQHTVERIVARKLPS